MLFIVSIDKSKQINYQLMINKQIKNKKNNVNYIDFYNYKLKIENDNEKKVLDDNNVFLMKNSILNNIFLAGHNNKIVFNRIYNLDIDDKVLLHYNNKNIIYAVYNFKYIDVYDTDVFKMENFNKLTLITCSNNNQKRFIVQLKRK